MSYTGAFRHTLRNMARKHRRSYVLLKKAWFWLTILPTLIIISIGKTIDSLIPKDPDLWIFPANFYTHDFSDNSRAIFELIKSDPDTRKVILQRTKRIPVPDGSVCTQVFSMRSPSALAKIVRAKIVFVEHSLYLDFAPLRTNNLFFFAIFRRKVINVWHGTPIKSLENLSITLPIRRELRHHHVVASSTIDKRVMADALYPIYPEHVHVTGLPRNDFLVRDETLLPDYYRLQLEAVRKMKGSNRLLLYAPTYRDTQIGAKYYEFSSYEVDQLREILSNNSAILAIRMHSHNRSVNFLHFIDGEIFYDFDQAIIPDLGMILRESDAVITDYSGLVVDMVYLGKPTISFAYDRAHYSAQQLGFIYPLELVFSAPICETFDELCHTLKVLLDQSIAARFDYSHLRQIFFSYMDDCNSERVVKLVRTLAA